MKRTSIREQLQRLLFLCSIVSLFLLGGIALLGMMGARINSTENGYEMGAKAAETVSDTLKQEAEDRLQLLAAERASYIGLEMQRLADRTELIRKEMNWILSHESEYPQRSIAEPSRENAGKFVPQLEFAAGLNREALAHEIGLTANIQDVMMQVAMMNGEDTIISAASKNGFTITVDTNSAERFTAPEDVKPRHFDGTSRPWYKLAKGQGKLTFTNVYMAKFAHKLSIACAVPYQAQNEFAGVVAMSTSLDKISQLVLNTQAETCFVVDNKGQMLFYKDDTGIIKEQLQANRGDNTLSNAGIETVVHKMTAGQSGVCNITIDGKNFYLAYAPIKQTGWSFAAALDAEDVLATETKTRTDVLALAKKNVEAMDAHMTKVILVMAVVIALIIFVVSWQGQRMSERLVRPILNLADGVREIASGNLDKKLAIHTGDEIEYLADSFNVMTDELQTYMRNLTQETAEKEHIATELNVATQIQESMLPNIFPPFPERSDFDIYAIMHAAKEVGGDFYDFYLLDDNHLMITIADVSGKGVPAALFMVISKTILKNFAMTMTGNDDLAAVVSCTNDQLCQNNDAMMFVTAFVGLLDIQTGKFVYVNAGHNPPLVYRHKTQQFSYMEVKRNFVLGGMDELDYQAQEMMLEPDDKLFFYTDGVTEALNEAEELYGEECLLKCLNAAGADRLDLKGLLTAVQKSLALHVGKAEQSDDISMMVMDYQGKQNGEV